jgi:uncharacterized protein with WD repeat
LCHVGEEYVVDGWQYRVGLSFLVSKKIVVIVVNMREKKNEIMNENEITNEGVRKLVECPKQQYCWSKYLKGVQIESGNEQNDVVTDMAPRFRPYILIGLE